jgi:transposase InsO family protein
LLSKQGVPIKQIVKRTGHSRKLVRSVLRGQRSDVFRVRQSSLEEWLPWLDNRWGQGAHNASALWREMREKGFRGQIGVVSEWARRRRLAEKADQSALARTPSARSIARLMTLARDDLSKSDAVLIAAIENNVPELTIARSLIADFQEMIRSKAVANLDGWLERANPRPNRVWNRIPEETRDQIIELALNEPELSPGELAVTFTDTKGYFVSESSVYRLLKAHDLITSPAFVVIKAADEFHDKTTAPNQLWHTDFTYLKVIGWGWFYLSTVLDDFSRYIIAWKLCTTTKAGDVTDTLTIALQASGCDSAKVVQRAAAPERLAGGAEGEVCCGKESRGLSAWGSHSKLLILHKGRLDEGGTPSRRFTARVEQRNMEAPY